LLFNGDVMSAPKVFSICMQILVMIWRDQKEVNSVVNWWKHTIWACPRYKYIRLCKVESCLLIFDFEKWTRA
jgi:hypothetical protein